MKTTFDKRKLIQQRQATYWTQEDLATASGVSVRTIQRMETGKNASLDSWKAIAAAFDIDVGDFKIINTFDQENENYFRAMLGTSIGCLGGLLGCSFGWAGFVSTGPEAFTTHPVLTAYLICMTGICIFTPIYIHRRYRPRS